MRMPPNNATAQPQQSQKFKQKTTETTMKTTTEEKVCLAFIWHKSDKYIQRFLCHRVNNEWVMNCNGAWCLVLRRRRANRRVESTNTRENEPAKFLLIVRQSTIVHRSYTHSHIERTEPNRTEPHKGKRVESVIERQRKSHNDCLNFV